MLSATFYRMRKAAAKKPWMVLLVLLAIAFSLFVIAVPSLSNGEDGIVRDMSLVLGGINILFIVMFNFIFYTGLKNGVVGFSHADVNFHLAGPFTQRFNLVIAAGGVFKLCIVLLWVLCCQASVLHMSIGVNSFDMLALLLGSVPVFAFGYFIAAFFSALFWDNEAARNKVKAVLVALDLIYVSFTVKGLMDTYGSFGEIRALGIRGIIAYAGTTPLSNYYPVAGWTNLIYSGILMKDTMYIVAGVLLTVLTAAAIIILYSKVDLNYYEAAMENAQKVADLQEAKKAGIDSDTAKVNRNIKVGKETLNKGWGASAFTQRHLFENVRASRFFFVNPLAITYRLITAVYMFVIGKSITFQGMDVDGGRSMGPIIAGVTMMVILNAVVYGGGKTVLEFNKPYIFMVPEKGSKKLFCCLMAELPEMAFDSLLCSLIMIYFADLTVAEGIAFGFLMVVFDLLFELIALVGIRIFRQLGRVLLVITRYFAGYIIIMTALAPMIIATVLTGSLAVGFAAAGGYGIVLAGVFLAIARNTVDKVELA